MNAVKIIEDANRSLENNEITLGEYDRIVTPLEDVKPVIHGHWIYQAELKNFTPAGSTRHCIRCSNCGALFRVKRYENKEFENSNFCGKCGAVMDEDIVYENS